MELAMKLAMELAMELVMELSKPKAEADNADTRFW